MSTGKKLGRSFSDDRQKPQFEMDEFDISNDFEVDQEDEDNYEDEDREI